MKSDMNPARKNECGETFLQKYHPTEKSAFLRSRALRGDGLRLDASVWTEGLLLGRNMEEQASPSLWEQSETGKREVQKW